MTKGRSKVGSVVCVNLPHTWHSYMVDKYLTDLTTSKSKVVRTEKWNAYSIFIGTRHCARQERITKEWYNPDD